MSQRLPYLSEDAIERDAAQLLAEFAQARRVTLAPPIPIEDVIEKHLRLRIDFDDLHALHSVPRPASGETAILGAIYGDGSIFVDESLDPEEHPSQENRYRFTLAHEVAALATPSAPDHGRRAADVPRRGACGRGHLLAEPDHAARGSGRRTITPPAC